jgi:threonine dehydratase
MVRGWPKEEGETIKETPLRQAERLAEYLSQRLHRGNIAVVVKDETEQNLGSYKIRGVLADVYIKAKAVFDRGGDLRDTIWVTESTGNHGKALAWAVFKGLPLLFPEKSLNALSGDCGAVKIFVPGNPPIPEEKRRALSEIGAEAVDRDPESLQVFRSYGEARAAVEKLNRQNAKVIHVEHDTDNVMSGHGVILLEIVEQLEKLGPDWIDENGRLKKALTVVVPAGSFGMAGGIALAAKELESLYGTKIRVVAAQSRNIQGGIVSLIRGKIVRNRNLGKKVPLEDGTAVNQIGKRAWKLFCMIGSAGIIVKDVARGVRELYYAIKAANGNKWFEGSVGVAIAALLEHPRIVDGPGHIAETVVVILSGGNTDKSQWLQAWAGWQSPPGCPREQVGKRTRTAGAIQLMTSRPEDPMSFFRGPDWYEKYVAPLWESPVWAGAVSALAAGTALTLTRWYQTPPSYHNTLWPAGWMAFLVTLTFTGELAARFVKTLHERRGRWPGDAPISAHWISLSFAVVVDIVLLVTYMGALPNSSSFTIDLPRLLFMTALMYTLAHTAFHLRHNITHPRDERMSLIGGPPAVKSFLPLVLLTAAGALGWLAHSHLGVSAGGFEAAGMFSLVSPLAWLAESVLAVIGLLAILKEKKHRIKFSTEWIPIEIPVLHSSLAMAENCIFQTVFVVHLPMFHIALMTAKNSSGNNSQDVVAENRKTARQRFRDLITTDGKDILGAAEKVADIYAPLIRILTPRGEPLYPDSEIGVAKKIVERFSGEGPDPHQFQHVLMVTWATDEELIEISRRYQGTEKPSTKPVSGFSGGTRDNFFDIEWQLASLPPDHISFNPKTLSGVEMLIIGPGETASWIIQLIQSYPDVGVIHIVDANRYVFQEIDKELESAYQINPELHLPSIYGYLANAMELPDSLNNRIDLSWDKSVFDLQYFTPTQLLQIGQQIVKVLKPYGVCISKVCPLPMEKIKGLKDVPTMHIDSTRIGIKEPSLLDQDSGQERREKRTSAKGVQNLPSQESHPAKNPLREAA